MDFYLHDGRHPRAGSIARGAQGLDVAVFRNADDEVFALLDRCPHKGGPLSQGIVFGRSVACPLHNWTIALSTGEAAAPDEGCTPYFSVRVQDGRCSCAPTSWPAEPWSRPARMPVLRIARANRLRHGLVSLLI
jgi:NAD(P)H-dependent nitrite reductase small subunit